MHKPIQIVVGGQFGSEAKGAIAAYLCVRDNVDFACRTGATNAGHTVVYTDAAGVAHRCAMQSLPVGWVNPHTRLILGAGTLIDLDILEREIDQVSSLTGEDVLDRLFIDHRAYIHVKSAGERSTASGRHHAIGATGKGCSEALMDRIRLRGLLDLTIGRCAGRGEIPIRLIPRLFDTERLLNQHYDDGDLIQLEGTQGQLLDLYLGPYPYTTHKQTGPAQWMLECGLSPALPTNIVMVVRTFPIRVAGNSGPLPNEISWSELTREINSKRVRAHLSPIVDENAVARFEDAVRQATTDSLLTVPSESDGLDQHLWSARDRTTHRIAVSELHRIALASMSTADVAELSRLFELTTVTKKLRRIARLDYAQLRVAARQIRPHQVAVTFMNYVFPERWATGDAPNYEEGDYLAKVASICDAPVKLINRGPDPAHIVQVGHNRRSISHA